MMMMMMMMNEYVKTTVLLFCNGILLTVFIEMIMVTVQTSNLPIGGEWLSKLLYEKISKVWFHQIT